MKKGYFSMYEQFFKDNTGQFSSGRLGFLIGVCISSILVVALALLGKLDVGIYVAYATLCGGGYATSKVSDAFGKESKDDYTV